MNIHLINGDKAKTYIDADRAYWGSEPWVAIWEGYEEIPNYVESLEDELVGIGKTEKEALNNLLEKSELLRNSENRSMNMR